MEGEEEEGDVNFKGTDNFLKDEDKGRLGGRIMNMMMMMVMMMVVDDG